MTHPFVRNNARQAPAQQEMKKNGIGLFITCPVPKPNLLDEIQPVNRNPWPGDPGRGASAMDLVVMRRGFMVCQYVIPLVMGRLGVREMFCVAAEE